MIVFKNGPVCFDVDDTLIMWEYHEKAPDLPTVTLKEESTGHSQTFQIHIHHVERIKMLKLTGKTIIVWSQSGSEWAEKVVVALGLEKFVDVVLEKPPRVYDDNPPASFIQQRYIKLYPEQEL